MEKIGDFFIENLFLKKDITNPLFYLDGDIVAVAKKDDFNYIELVCSKDPSIYTNQNESIIGEDLRQKFKNDSSLGKAITNKTIEIEYRNWFTPIIYVDSKVIDYQILEENECDIIYNLEDFKGIIKDKELLEKFGL